MESPAGAVLMRNTGMAHCGRKAVPQRSFVKLGRTSQKPWRLIQRPRSCAESPLALVFGGLWVAEDGHPADRGGGEPAVQPGGGALEAGRPARRAGGLRGGLRGPPAAANAAHAQRASGSEAEPGAAGHGRAQGLSVSFLASRSSREALRRRLQGVSVLSRARGVELEALLLG